VGGQCHTLTSLPPGNYTAERENTDMDTVSWALAAVLKDGERNINWVIIVLTSLLYTQYMIKLHCAEREKYTYGQSILGSSSNTHAGII
jgi:hypothetical protein